MENTPRLRNEWRKVCLNCGRLGLKIDDNIMNSKSNNIRMYLIHLNWQQYTSKHSTENLITIQLAIYKFSFKVVSLSHLFTNKTLIQVALLRMHILINCLSKIFFNIQTSITSNHKTIATSFWDWFKTRFEIVFINVHIQSKLKTAHPLDNYPLFLFNWKIFE